MKNNPHGYNQYNRGPKKKKSFLQRMKKRIGDIPISTESTSGYTGATRTVTTLSGRKYKVKPTKKQQAFVAKERDRVKRETAAFLKRKRIK